ncbi:reverse transcriptase, partial [Phytophthora megakarya]
IDYVALEKDVNRGRIQLVLASEIQDPEVLTEDPISSQPLDPDSRGPDLEPSQRDPNSLSGDPAFDGGKVSDPEKDNLADLDPRWIHAHISFKVSKEKIATTPILRHFDPDRQAVVVVYASDWAISGALMQEYDQINYPVIFTSRTLKSNELNYGIAEKEVLALLRTLDLNHNTLVGRPIRWAALLSPWILEIVKCNKGEDKILGTLAASIPHRSEVDKALTSIARKKQLRRKIQAPIPTVRSDEDLYVASFDGSARVKRGGGAYSAILGKLPEWTVVKARSGYAEGLTINEAEYHGFLLSLDLLEGTDPLRLVICVRGDIDCKAPGLAFIRQKALNRLWIRPDHELLDPGSGHIEILVVKFEDPVVQISAITTRSKARSGVRSGSNPPPLSEEVIRELRIERIRQTQDEEAWIHSLKKYLTGELRDLTQEEARSCGSIAMNYEVHHDLLFYCPTTKESAADRDKLMRLVFPETLHQDVLHYYHTSLQGGHQGIGRTFDRIRCHFHLRGLYRSVQRYVGEYVDCETGKGRPRIQGESPGNLQATYPFQVIAMDYIPSLPRSYKGNTELLIFEDLFCGYVIAKVSGSRTAQTVAEPYEECVFHRFGVSEVIRHDREPGFMSDIFRALTKILDQRQQATMAYRPQANGSAARTVQITTRALKMYVQDTDQRGWDEYAERLTFAINTARNRILGERPFYMVHDWDPISTLEPVIVVKSVKLSPFGVQFSLWSRDFRRLGCT